MAQSEALGVAQVGDFSGDARRFYGSPTERKSSTTRVARREGASKTNARGRARVFGFKLDEYRE